MFSELANIDDGKLYSVLNCDEGLFSIAGFDVHISVRFYYIRHNHYRSFHSSEEAYRIL